MTYFRISSLWIFAIGLGIQFLGCGSSSLPTGCPSDLSIPEKMEILGAQHDDSLFVLRLKTNSLEISEVIASFKDTMKENDWKVKVDSATDSNGGELEFAKEARKCVVFIAFESKAADQDKKAIKIDVKCDREIVR